MTSRLLRFSPIRCCRSGVCLRGIIGIALGASAVLGFRSTLLYHCRLTKSLPSNTNRVRVIMEDKKRKSSAPNDGVIDLTSDDEKIPTKKKPARRETNGGNGSFISLATYNIWFGPPHPFDRMSGICDAISSKSSGGNELPMFVGLQEVTPELSQMLFPLLESLGYETIGQDLSSTAYGCAIAIQNGCKVIRSGFVPYEATIMGRGIVWALCQLKDSGDEVLFTSTHLESFMRNYPRPGQTYDGAQQREQQLLQLKQFCENCMKKRSSVIMAVISGDLNWDDERKRSEGMDKPMLSVLGNEWVDAWLENRPGEDGYTYDSKENQMLKGNLRRRFDRFLLRSKNPQEVTIEETDLIGKQPIPDRQWEKEPHPMARSQKVSVVPVLPSDHFGLYVKLQLGNS